MKKSLFKIIIFGFLIITTSCRSQFATKEMKNHFSNKQIKDLQKITLFFKNQICEEDNSDFKECFNKILPSLIRNGFQPILKKVDFKKQKQLCKTISESTFDEIWSFGKARYTNKKGIYRSIGSKYNGQYQKFLAEIGKKNEEVKKYSKYLSAAGAFEEMGLLQRNIYHKPKYFNLDNPNIQLLIAIHYLSQNDDEKRMEKWQPK